ncbi:hypothetical protein T07_13898 [Trichinella nelsoni]|uniref:Uncharacterized protein n=1 Tax=Trichinella nelsoni TaxID=6336 RepID=A0A0V0SI54_9BILA|nr:hypothetical protein T07_13898 [Trichinella nelsoni]
MERISTVCTICQELVVERAFLLLSILLIYCFKLLGCEMMFKDNAEGVLSQPALSVGLKIPFQGHISRIVKLEIFTQTCNHEVIKVNYALEWQKSIMEEEEEEEVSLVIFKLNFFNRPQIGYKG